MKNMHKQYGIIVFITIIGLLISSCGIITFSTVQSEPNPFLGSWTGTDSDGDRIIATFTSTRITLSFPPGPGNSTTYTINNNIATFTGPGFTGTVTITDNVMTILAGGEVFATLVKN